MVDKFPVTPAIRVLREAKISFEPFEYRYEEKGGTAASASALNVPEEIIVKTLIFEDEGHNPLIVLMPGVREVSTKNLARILNKKLIQPCKPEIAQKHSGYLVGGTSPFGTKKSMPVYLEKEVLQHPKIYINGGKRGFLVAINPQDLLSLLKCHVVEVGI